MAVSSPLCRKRLNVLRYCRRIRDTEDAKGADVNFDDIVISGGSVEAVRVDTCKGHVNSESVQQQRQVSRLTIRNVASQVANSM